MQNDQVRLRGYADIVFVLDVSPSMNDVIDSLRKHIESFVDLLLNDPQSTVKSARIGLVLHGLNPTPTILHHDFTEEAQEFARFLEEPHRGGDEFGLPAIDRALDFPWREVCRRYIVMFSDENVSAGHDPKRQRSLVHDLAKKMANLNVHFVSYNTRSCTAYSLLGRTPGSTFSIVDRSELVGPNMMKLLTELAGTVSTSNDAGMMTVERRNLYQL